MCENHLYMSVYFFNKLKISKGTYEITSTEKSRYHVMLFMDKI